MRGSPQVFSDLGKGVNLQGAPYSLGEGEAREALNVKSSPSGAIKKRNGCVTLATPTAAFNSLFGANLATDIMIGASGKKLYRVSTAGTITELTGGEVTENLRWEWTQAPLKGGKGPVFGVNGTDTPKYWDGTGTETKKWEAEGATAVPNGKLITYHDNRVFIAKESTLYWSELTNPFNWTSPAGGSVQVDPEDGQEITGLGKVGPYLIIFKNRKAFLLTNSSEGLIRRVSADMGCIAPRSVAATEIGTFFLTPDNQLIVTDGQSFNKNISEPIMPLLEEMNGPIQEKACAVHSGDSYFLSFSKGGSVNDIIVEYDLVQRAWWVHSISYTSSERGGVNQFALLDPSNSATLYAAGASTVTPRILQCFKKTVFSDLSEQIYPAYWISPWHTFGLPHIRKRVRQIRVDAKGTYTLSTYRAFRSETYAEENYPWESSGSEGTVFGGTGEFGGAGTFGDELVIAENRFYTPGVGRAWSLKFLSEANQDLEIYSYTMAINYRKD